MPFDLELTPVYRGLTAVYALGSCIGVIVPRSGGSGYAFFHYDAAQLTFGETEEAAVELFYRMRGTGMLRDLYEIYGSAENYFMESILGVVGKQNTVSKKQLLEAVLQTCEGQREKIGRLRDLHKAELFERLVKAWGPEKAIHAFPVGIAASAFIRRFDVTRVELEKLARLGIVRQTGEYRLRDGTVCKLFSIWDYFNLDPEEVRVAVERMRAGVQSEGIATACGLAMTEGADCRVAGAPRNDSGSGEPE